MSSLPTITSTYYLFICSDTFMLPTWGRPMREMLLFYTWEKTFGGFKLPLLRALFRVYVRCFYPCQVCNVACARRSFDFSAAAMTLYLHIILPANTRVFSVVGSSKSSLEGFSSSYLTLRQVFRDWQYRS